MVSDPTCPQTPEIESADTGDDIILLQRTLELERKRLQLAKDFGLVFYRPWDKQDSFHRAKAKRRMLRAGNRSGKSTMGAAEDCAWLLGERPWLALDDPDRRAGIPQRPVKGLIITTDWDKVKEIWTGEDGDRPGKIWQFLPKGSVKKSIRNHSGAIETIVLNNGSTLRIDTVESFKKNPMGSESSDWDFIHVDEPCPEAMWKATSRGLMDRGGFAWFTLTPLSEFWINDMFFPRPVYQGNASGTLGVQATGPQGAVATTLFRWSTSASTYENPYLSMENIKEFESGLTEDEKQCRINGIPLELSGLVYKQFTYEKHVLKTVPKGWADFNSPPSNYVVYLSIDPHPQTPHAVLFVAVSPLGQRFIYRELWVPERPIALLASQILRVVGNAEIARAEADPIAWIEHPVSDLTMADEFARNGLVLLKASKDRTYGTLHMQGEFAKDDNVYVSPNLTRFLFEINRYCYDKENKPVDKDDHMMECMYRIFIQEPRWYDAKADNAPVEDETFEDRNLDLSPVDLAEV